MEKNVHGFTVRCEVLGSDAEGFTLIVVTSQPSICPDGLTWTPPDQRSYATREDAERQAKYLLLGIDSVEPSGKPKFTVT